MNERRAKDVVIRVMEILLDVVIGPATGMDSTITTEPNQVMGLFACLTGCRRTSDGTNVACLLTSHHLAGNAFENGRGLVEACDRDDACCELTAFSRRGCEE